MAKEVIVSEGRLNKVIIEEKIRPNGTRRISQNFENCPTMAEQHTGHLTDINYLVKKYKPDELAAYIAARSQYRTEILGHDFSQEPDLVQARSIVYRSRQEFEKLPEEIRIQFKNHVEFLKFMDNPANEERMIKLGILTKRQVDAVKIEDPVKTNATTSPKTKDEKTKEPQ